MKYLFLFTISPVQAFISQARKTQDLYAGSRLLSDLIRFSINKFIELSNDNESDVIFPANHKEEDAALPNRFLANLNIDENNAQELGKQLEEAVRKEFKRIARDIFNEYVEEPERNKIKNHFFWQIENHLVIYWLFEPEDDRGYKEAYRNIERNLGAIKNLREFQQLPDWETGRKDSITGELNALIFNKGGKPNAFNEQAIEISVQPVYLSYGEGLSAVSFTKRFYYKLKETGSFPSTAEIAQYDIKDEIENLNDYKNILLGNFDFQLLYKENLNKDYFRKHLLNVNDGFLESVIDEYKKLKFPQNKKQKKYYAVLVFDGDDMGQWLSGDKLDKKTDETLINYHKKFSELLGKFALSAKNYVDNNKFGKTIYAGGDDFLALLNLDKLFEVLIGLREKFDTELNQKLKKDFNISADFTFSAGLIIAHYKEPLGEVLNGARKMESKAKENPGKNSLGIAVLKHSGEMHEVVIKWGNKNQYIHNLNNILLQNLQNGTFGPAFIENLNREFEVFRVQEKSIVADDMIETEIKRLVSRAYNSKRKDNETKAEFLERKKEEIKSMQDSVFNMYIGNSVANFLDMLNIIDFIYRKS